MHAAQRNAACLLDELAHAFFNCDMHCALRQTSLVQPSINKTLFSYFLDVHSRSISFRFICCDRASFSFVANDEIDAHHTVGLKAHMGITSDFQDR